MLVVCRWYVDWSVGWYVGWYVGKWYVGWHVGGVQTDGREGGRRWVGAVAGQRTRTATFACPRVPHGQLGYLIATHGALADLGSLQLNL